MSHKVLAARGAVLVAKSCGYLPHRAEKLWALSLPFFLRYFRMFESVAHFKAYWMRVHRTIANVDCIGYESA